MKVKKGLTCSSKIGKEKEIGKWVFEAMGAQGQEGVTDILGGRSRSQRAEKMFFGGEFSPVCEIEGVRGSRQLKSAFGPLTQPTLKSKGTTTSLTTFTHLSQSSYLHLEAPNLKENTTSAPILCLGICLLHEPIHGLTKNHVIY